MSNNTASCPRTSRRPGREAYLRRVAIHEAGHAVVCLALYGRFQRVTLRSNGTFGGRVIGIPESCLPTAHHALVAAAGAAADYYDSDRSMASLDRAMLGMGTGADDGDLAYLLELQREGMELGPVHNAAGALVFALFPLIEVTAEALLQPSPLRALRRREIEAALAAAPDAWERSAERLAGVVANEPDTLDYVVSRNVATFLRDDLRRMGR
jgi:hypothetical protein